MSGSFPISRRSLLAGLAAVAGLGVLPGRAEETPPSDRGIGGTGITGRPEQDQAIGFLGSIQRFGSIYVNGERISYPDNATVVIDGIARRPHDLLIGQVVKTVAARRDGHLWTDRIDVTSEVIGPVERLDGEAMTVLGQQVVLGTTGTSDFTIGQRLAISGIRRTDGTIVARLVEPAGNRADQVLGTAFLRGWTLRIGGLQLFGPDWRYDGHRVLVRGRRTERGMMVSTIALDGLPDGAGVGALSIEAYVAHHGSEVQLGSGFVLSDAKGSISSGITGQPSVVQIDLAGGGSIGGVGSGSSATTPLSPIAPGLMQQRLTPGIPGSPNVGPLSRGGAAGLMPGLAGMAISPRNGGPYGPGRGRP